MSLFYVSGFTFTYEILFIWRSYPSVRFSRWRKAAVSARRLIVDLPRASALCRTADVRFIYYKVVKERGERGHGRAVEARRIVCDRAGQTFSAASSPPRTPTGCAPERPPYLAASSRMRSRNSTHISLSDISSESWP